MTQKTKRAVPKPVTPRPVPPLKGNGKTPPTESVEVLGRHKNSGQKDHKGAR
jgi:hypothetical protein